MSLEFNDLIGLEIQPHIEDIATLRLEVFREFPYLYEGTMEYERSYLQKLADSPHGYVVLARDEERIVGASTALPLADAEPEFQKPFLEAGLDVDDFFYFGESLLLPQYRRQKAGRRFFREREDQASFLAFPQACFCAVVRPPDHPARPSDYRGLEAYWRQLGYQQRADLRTTFGWRDVGDQEESQKTMEFWTRKMKAPD